MVLGVSTESLDPSYAELINVSGCFPDAGARQGLV